MNPPLETFVIFLLAVYFVLDTIRLLRLYDVIELENRLNEDWPK